MGNLRNVFLVFCLGLAFMACRDSASGNEDGGVVFEFITTGNEHFFARTSDPDLIQKAHEQLSLPEKERNLFINGKIERGTKQNTGWSWHFVPGEWDLVEISAEVCDGRPSFVEEDLDYWVNEVGRFCPWNSHLLRKVK